MPLTLKELMDDLPATGQVEWIGVRPARKQAMESVEAVQARCGTGLVGDRYTGKSGKRDVTLIQHEHLAAIAGFLGQKIVTPESLRRNIVVRGVNLLALKGRLFRTGDVVLEFTGLCHPCSAMQERFGPGGYNAVRGHGGITARILHDGIIRVGDSVKALAAETNRKSVVFPGTVRDPI